MTPSVKFKTTCAFSLAVLLVMAMLMGVAAVSAQSGTTDLCGLPLRGAIGGLDATPVPQYSGNYPGGGYPSTYYSGSYGYYGEDMYYTPQPTPTATPLPQPVNPATKSCEFGRVLIAVSTDWHGTYRIGDTIVVDVYINTASDVQVNFDNLIQLNQVVFGNSDFEMAAAPTLETSEEDGRIQYHLHLRVRSFVMRDVLTLTFDALYATEYGDGNTPVWKRLTTPGLVITTTRTADHGQEMLQGDVEQRYSGGTWLAPVLMWVAGLTLILAFALLVIPPLRRWMKRKPPVDPNEQTWRIFNQALARGKQNGFTRGDYKEISAALRAYLSREPATLREIEIVSSGDESINDIRSALRKLDAIVFAPVGEEKTLHPKEIEQLERELTRIVPRSKSSKTA